MRRTAIRDRATGLVLGDGASADSAWMEAVCAFIRDPLALDHTDLEVVEYDTSTHKITFESLTLEQRT